MSRKRRQGRKNPFHDFSKPSKPLEEMAMVSSGKPDPSLSSYPFVSLCTVTYNRAAFLPLLEKRILDQTYPRERMEWVLIDDSPAGVPDFVPSEASGLKVVYRRLDEKLPLGQKRNLSHTFCEGEIIVYLDDDDYYPPTRVEHAVRRLLDTGCLVAGSTLLPILFLPEKELWLAGPYGQHHATAGTFAFRRELLKQTAYSNDASRAEERFFLKNYSFPLAQLDPKQTILCIGHDRNTFEKRLLIQNKGNPRFRQLNQAEGPTAELLEEVASQYVTVMLSSSAPVGLTMQSPVERGDSGAIVQALPSIPILGHENGLCFDSNLVHFKIVITARVPAVSIDGCIQSLRQQKHHNFRAIVIVDPSTELTPEQISIAIDGDERFKVFMSPVSMHSSLEAFLKGVELLQPGCDDVMIEIDGVDRLLGDDALQLISHTYQRHQCLLTYGSYVRASDHQVVGSACLARTTLAHSFRQVGWCAAPLRSFKAGLLPFIVPSDLGDEAGAIDKQADASALFLLFLELAAGRMIWIPDPLLWLNDLGPLEGRLSSEITASVSFSRLRSIPPFAPAPFLSLATPPRSGVATGPDHQSLLGQAWLGDGRGVQVSVIVPTRNRPAHLTTVIRHFQAQTWPNKQMLILDDSATACAEAIALSQADARVTYLHRQSPQSLGEKLRQLCDLASGDIIARFDDDDYYAPDYLAFMVGDLLQHGCDFVSLRSWCCWHARSGVYGFCNSSLSGLRYSHLTADGITVLARNLTREELDSNAYGHGFSHVFSRSALLKLSGLDHSLPVDSSLLRRFVDVGCKIMFLDDLVGRVVHGVHPHSTSSCFAQHLLTHDVLASSTTLRPLPPTAFPPAGSI
ncbi:glycosyltransferase family 2 protein [Synechococcus sp. CBW1002]|uniref:glycosyltransferase n=1 Tax=Synechococcus sp. CBW1002 TaxID=1353134 RepID=UPI0018CE2DE7|nr:glycosyltransferase [Synechococcus sp. CBW1002]QPN60174.1 glycosyltransferase family 2 protein [Synechococcus sp. CBW1002]